MKRISIAVILVSVLGILPLHAKGQGFGIGVIAGEPTGVTAKTYLSGNDAVDMAASWSFIRDVAYLHVDYIRHFPGVIDRDFDDFILYAGIGGLIELGEENAFGARMPIFTVSPLISTIISSMSSPIRIFSSIFLDRTSIYSAFLRSASPDRCTTFSPSVASASSAGGAANRGCLIG